MGLPRRRTFWFSAALLLAVVVGSWLFMPQSRVTQENFDRLRDGMTPEEVVAILGEETEGWKRPDSRTRVFLDCRYYWSGPNLIVIEFQDARLTYKDLHLETAWKTLQWYAGWTARKFVKLPAQ